MKSIISLAVVFALWCGVCTASTPKVTLITPVSSGTVFAPLKVEEAQPAKLADFAALPALPALPAKEIAMSCPSDQYAWLYAFGLAGASALVLMQLYDGLMKNCNYKYGQ